MFFSTLLILGFGWGAWPLAGVVILLSAGISALMLGVDVVNISSNWAERRCDPDVMITAFLYKPPDDPRTRSQFSTENFQFCVSKVFDESLKMFMTPFLGMFGKQMDNVNVLTNIFSTLRFIKAELMNNFMKLFNPLWERYKATAMEYAVNHQRLRAAFSRISAMALSILFMGFSLQTTLMNIVNFVVMVVLIMLGIMAALIIILWFPLLPVLWIIFTVIAVIGSVGLYSTGGLGGAFCFDPNTKVRMKDGMEKTLRECKLGDVLEGGARIEGILETDASKEQIYDIDGIRVSGSHLLWCDTAKEWKAVHEFATAKPTVNTLTTLLCLRTSTREIPLYGTSGAAWRFRDWEELPLNLGVSDSLWDWLVSHILNKSAPTWKETPKEDPLLGGKCVVRLQTGERIPVSQIQIGDTIYSREGFTKVLGIYSGVGSLQSESGMTDGIWVSSVGTAEWSHPAWVSGREQRGYHIVTESGTFWVETGSFSGFVRDFTEVGHTDLFLTYGFTEALLKRATRIKKSLNREESCEQDFLLRDFLSCLQPIF